MPGQWEATTAVTVRTKSTGAFNRPVGSPCDLLVRRAVREELAELPVEGEVCLCGRGAEQAEGPGRRYVPLQRARQAVQGTVHQGCAIRINDVDYD